jgi:hypothetical protein
MGTKEKCSQQQKLAGRHNYFTSILGKYVQNPKNLFDIRCSVGVDYYCHFCCVHCCFGQKDAQRINTCKLVFIIGMLPVVSDSVFTK